MSRSGISFKYVDDVETPKFWSIHVVDEDVNIDDKLLKIFESNITEDIKKINKVLMTSYTTQNDEKIKLNIFCYDIEYLDITENIQRFIYIPCNKLEQFIREQKLKRILNDNR